MDNLIQQGINKIKQFATNTFQAAAPVVSNFNTGMQNAYKSFAVTPQKIQQTNQSMGNFYKGFAVNPQKEAQTAYKTFTTPGNNPFYDSYMGSKGSTPGQVNVPKFNFAETTAAKIKNPIGSTAVNLGLSLPQMALNLPSMMTESAGKMNRGIVEGVGNLYKASQGQKVNTNSVVRNIADIAELPVNVLLMSEGGADILKSNSLKRKITEGIQGGWNFGSATGGLNYLQNIKDTDTIDKILPQLASEYVKGGGQGAIAGAVLGTVSYGFDKATGKPIIPDIFNGKTMQQANSMLKLAHEGINRGDAKLVIEAVQHLENPKGYYNPDGTANINLIEQHRSFIEDFYKQMTGDTKSKLPWETKAKQMFELVRTAAKNNDIWNSAENSILFLKRNLHKWLKQQKMDLLK